MNEEIVRQIEQLVAAEVMTSQALSNTLFGPLGLFGKLAKTREERQAMTQTPLFRRAMARVSELERFERTEFQEELERKCKARSGQAAANGPTVATNGPANGAPSEQPARTDTSA